MVCGGVLFIFSSFIFWLLRFSFLLVFFNGGREGLRFVLEVIHFVVL